MNTSLNKQNNNIYWPTLHTNIGLFMVWPLDHTIALRKLSLLLAAIVGWMLVRRSPQSSEILRQPWLILGQRKQMAGKGRDWVESYLSALVIGTKFEKLLSESNC